MDIMIKPVVTEKANALTEKLNRYTFKVTPSANQYQIKSLVESLYGVKVVAVNTMNYDGKRKSRYTKSGMLNGKVAAFKKAVVTLAEGETINFYSNI